MALAIPTSGQWITFPTKPADAVWIAWKEGVDRSAVYYITKCWWGNFDVEAAETDTKWEPKSSGQVTLGTGKTNIKVMGETKLFIAAEFIEPQYQGGVLDVHHILSLAGSSKWITMQLNEKFRYGQNGSGSTLRRWIVYDAPIDPSIKAPNIFQHRFTGLTSADFAKAAATELPSMAPKEFALAAKAAGKLADLGTSAMKTAVGHSLHHFLDQKGLDVAKEIADKVTTVEAARAAALKASEKKAPIKGTSSTTEAQKGAALAVVPKLSQVTKRLIATQLAEIMYAQVENEKTDAGALQRFQQESEYLRKAQATQRKATGFFAKIKELVTKKPQYTDLEKFNQEILAYAAEDNVYGDADEAVQGDSLEKSENVGLTQDDVKVFFKKVAIEDLATITVKEPKADLAPKDERRKSVLDNNTQPQKAFSKPNSEKSGDGSTNTPKKNFISPLLTLNTNGREPSSPLLKMNQRTPVNPPGKRKKQDDQADQPDHIFNVERGDTIRDDNYNAGNFSYKDPAKKSLHLPNIHGDRDGLSSKGTGGHS